MAVTRSSASARFAPIPKQPKLVKEPVVKGQRVGKLKASSAKKDPKSATEEKKVAAKGALEVGDSLPDSIILNTQKDEPVNISELIAQIPIVVIFAYPKASTPGCTRQACGFRDNFNNKKLEAMTEKSKVKVFGISADSPTAQLNFKNKQGLPFDLLADRKRDLIGVLGAKKTPAQGVIRSHWVFFNGKLKFKHVQISPENSVQVASKEIDELLKEI